MMEDFQQLLPSDFMPHGFCYQWNPQNMWLRFTSDGLLPVPYYRILLILIDLICKSRDSLFNRILAMFAVFFPLPPSPRKSSAP